MLSCGAYPVHVQLHAARGTPINVKILVRHKRIARRPARGESMHVFACRTAVFLSTHRQPREVEGIPSKRVEREYVPQLVIYAVHRKPVAGSMRGER